MLYLCCNNCSEFNAQNKFAFHMCHKLDIILIYQSQYSYCPCAHAIICDPAPFSFRKTSDKIELVVTGPYGLVRHPVCTSVMLAIWITPTLVSIYICWNERSYHKLTSWNSYLELCCSQCIYMNSAKSSFFIGPQWVVSFPGAHFSKHVWEWSYTLYG